MRWNVCGWAAGGAGGAPGPETGKTSPLSLSSTVSILFMMPAILAFGGSAVCSRAVFGAALASSSSIEIVHFFIGQQGCVISLKKG
eukprot:COSAG04_NODE_3215_length_3038_cov_28.235114_1_plen_85_part_10